MQSDLHSQNSAYWAERRGKINRSEILCHCKCARYQDIITDFINDYEITEGYVLLQEDGATNHTSWKAMYCFHFRWSPNFSSHLQPRSFTLWLFSVGYMKESFRLKSTIYEFEQKVYDANTKVSDSWYNLYWNKFSWTGWNALMPV